MISDFFDKLTTEEIVVFSAAFIFILIYIFALISEIKKRFWDKPHREIEDLCAELELYKNGEEINKYKKAIKSNKIKISKLEHKISVLEKAGSKSDNEIAYYSEQYSLLQDKYITLENKYREMNIYYIKRDEPIQRLLNDFLKNSESNLSAIPYMARIMADYETYGIEILKQQLNWGYSQERQKKVKSLITLRKETREMLEKYKAAEYQLAYLIELYPALQDIIDCEFNDLPITDFTKISDYDKTRDFLSREEYLNLSTTERNQLALDRYLSSKNKSKWQIGRDYEMYVGYKYSKKGFKVDYHGSYMGLEDLGRDLIVKKDNITLIVQCKYWSSSKEIHEKHITQLYGTTACYCLENNIDKDKDKVIGVLITNITLSDKAKQMADYLGVHYKENYQKHNYPCIKCNVGHDEFGCKTKIYHLPFDQQYDATKIDGPEEFFAMTVEEAENAGFRRAFKWHSE